MAYAMTYTVLGPLFGVFIDKGITLTLLLQGVPKILCVFFAINCFPSPLGLVIVCKRQSVAISFLLLRPITSHCWPGGQA